MKFVLLAFFLNSSLSFGVQLIELKEEVMTPPRSNLNLWKLVNLEASPGAEGLEAKLSLQSLMESPALGERAELSFQSVAGHLKLALSPSDRLLYKFSIPRKIKVVSKLPELTEEYVSQILSQQWVKLCGECKVHIQNIRLPLGKFENWKIETQRDLPRGGFNIPLISYDKDGKESRYWIQGSVELMKELPVAQRALYIGERVQATDFNYQWQPVTHATDGPPEKSSLVGMMVKAPVAANQVIWSRNLIREKALKKGEQVRVITQGKLWELSVPAISTQDGEVGDTVTLKNPKTDKTLIGLVVGKGEVEIK